MFTSVLGEPFSFKHTRLEIDRKVVKRLIAEGREALPSEYSALLAGNGSRITRHYPFPATGHSPQSFAWDGPHLLHTLHLLVKQGLVWQGVMHTHPAAPAIPSVWDERGWHYPSLSYWILSFAGECPSLHLYQWVDGRFRKRAFVINENDHPQP